MRIVAPVILIGAACADQTEFGIWKLNPARSTFTGDIQPKSVIVRIEPHAKGEVFTLDRIEADGRTTSSSTILYFDGAPRDFEDFDCSGTQSFHRVDKQAVEILRNCQGGAWIRVARRQSTQTKELTLEITERHPDGHRTEKHFVLEKQSESAMARDQ